MGAISNKDGDVAVKFLRPYDIPVFAKDKDGHDVYTGQRETGWRVIELLFHPLYADQQIAYYQRKGFRLYEDEPAPQPSPTRGDTAVEPEPEPAPQQRRRRKE